MAPFPFADYSVTKLRPAVLMSALPQSAWLVIYVTSSLNDQTDYDVILKPSAENNLKVQSLARVNRLTVISSDMISRKLGDLSKADKKRIYTKLNLLSENFIK